MLSKKKIFESVKKYESLDAQIKALEALRDAEKDAITKEMERRGVEEFEIENKVVRWTQFVRSSFDSSAFKKAHPDVYAEYQKQSVGHRFSISG